MPGVQLNVPTMATLGTDADVSRSCTSSLQTQTYFWSSLLSTQKVLSENPSHQTISVT